MLEILKDFGISFLSAFLNIVLPTLAALLAGYVIAWLKKKFDFENLQIVKDIVKAAVLAAEQENLAGRIKEKKEYALTMAENWLSTKGIKFDLTTLDGLIEAAVMDEFNRYRESNERLLGGND